MALMLDQKAIEAALPQGPDFIFLDSADVGEATVDGRYQITGKECFSGSHFPDRFVFPASIMMEALGQLGITYLHNRFSGKGLDPASIFFISSEDVSCRRQCRPGDVLEMHLEVLREREPLIVFSGGIHVAAQHALKVSALTLSFSTKRAV